MRFGFLALITLAACGSPLSPSVPDFIGRASVIDGATIEIKGQPTRLWGFDTPERGARCGSENVHQRAALALDDMFRDRVVQCWRRAAPSRDREVAWCTYDVG